MPLSSMPTHFKTHRYRGKAKKKHSFKLYALFPTLCNYVFKNYRFEIKKVNTV